MIVRPGLVLMLVVWQCAFAEIVNFEEIVEEELFHEQARIEGRIGRSLVLTNSDSLKILDTVDATVTYTTRLQPGVSVHRVSASPQSTVGIIEIHYQSETGSTRRTFIYREGTDFVLEGNKVISASDGLYPDRKSPSESRNKDYLIAESVNPRGDLLVTSFTTRNQVVVEKLIPTGRGDVGPDSISGNYRSRTIVFEEEVNSRYLCTNADSSAAVILKKNHTGTINSVEIIQFSGSSSTGNYQLLAEKAIVQVAIQCIGGDDGVLEVMVDATLNESMEFNNLPAKTMRTGVNNYDKTTTNYSKSNHVRAFYDGAKEFLTPGYLRSEKSSKRKFPTPVDTAVYLDIQSMGTKHSNLSTMNQMVAIRIPEQAMQVIEYPYRAKDKRLYCVFGHRGDDIYKACYLALLKK